MLRTSRRLRLRSFATSAAPKALNLTPLVSPLLLRLHPDTVQRHSAALASENEAALKALNQFLELATAGCNGDARAARRFTLGLAAGAALGVSAPLRLPLRFHVPLGHQDELAPVAYTIQVPGALVHRTLAGSSNRTRDPSAALHSPLAREWQRATKRILQDLFEVAAIPLMTEDADDGATRSTALALWLAEEETPERQHGVDAAAHNRERHREHAAFEKTFHSMLTRERNIVFETTTGLEDGPSALLSRCGSLCYSSDPNCHCCACGMFQRRSMRC